MANLYLHGYGNPTIGYGPYGSHPTPRTKEWIMAQTQFAKTAPELMRRLFALADAVQARYGPLTYGFGGGWRSSNQQYTLFQSRYDKGSCPGDVYWDGQPSWLNLAGCYHHVSGASAAPPGTSNHETQTVQGYGVAVDMVGNHAYANSIAGVYGLKDFSDVNGEPWHYQPIEVPNSGKNYTNQFDYPTAWPLPGSPIPPPPLPDPGEDEMTPHKPTRVYDSRGEGLAPFAPGEARLIPVCFGTQASIGGGVFDNDAGWWAYSTRNDFANATSFVNAIKGVWTSWGAIPVVAEAEVFGGTKAGNIWVYSLKGGHIYIDTYATG